jgi:hypothetical protein
MFVTFSDSFVSLKNIWHFYHGNLELPWVYTDKEVVLFKKSKCDSKTKSSCRTHAKRIHIPS